MQWLSFLQMREAATCMQEVFQFIMSINISRNMLLLLCSISLEFGLKQLSIVFCIGSAAIKLSLQKFAASVDGWAYHVGCFSEELMTGAILFCQHKSELCYGKLPVGCSDRFRLLKRCPQCPIQNSWKSHVTILPEQGQELGKGSSPDPFLLIH